jgi:hypothetical protein
MRDEEVAMLVFGIFFLALMVFMIVSMWKVYEKANQPGWACIVPFYNYMVLGKMAGKSDTWGLLMIIPYAGIVFAIIAWNQVAKRFGKTEGFTVGLILLPFVFIPILAFGNAKYNDGKVEEDFSSDILDDQDFLLD